MCAAEAPLGDAERAALLAFADDEHLMGQRHTEWIGVAPFLEEDLAFSSIAQDELGHAAALYELVAGDAALVDGVAFGRSAADYRSCWLVEAPCTDWAQALVRHWCYDAAEELRWQALSTSTDQRVGWLAERALREEHYHRRHADALLDALAGDAVARDRIRTALTFVVPLAVGIFESPAGAAGADHAVVGQPLEELREPWLTRLAARFAAVDVPASLPAQLGRTKRSAPFEEVYARMREVVSIDPAARW
jgi:ring-1,2-phenylacetyl-CoA epoxidase subunit PaaC